MLVNLLSSRAHPGVEGDSRDDDHVLDDELVVGIHSQRVEKIVEHGPRNSVRASHFETLDRATPSAAATYFIVSPVSIRAIARSRKSIERGFAMRAGLKSCRDLESNPAALET